MIVVVASLILLIWVLVLMDNRCYGRKIDQFLKRISEDISVVLSDLPEEERVSELERILNTARSIRSVKKRAAYMMEEFLMLHVRHAIGPAELISFEAIPKQHDQWLESLVDRRDEDSHKQIRLANYSMNAIADFWDI